MLGLGRVSKREGSRESRSAALLEALDENAGQLEPRAFVGVHASHPREGDFEAAREGRFRVGGELRTLRPPVDWSRRPYEESDEGAFLLNCFFFADPVMAAEVPDDTRASLFPSLAVLFEDWIEQNPQDHPSPHKYAWYDHSAAARLVHLSHLLRESSRLGGLDRGQRQVLAASAIEHVDFLLADENYQHGHNHGMFSDAALHLAADALPFIPESEEWATVAAERFRETVDRTIETTEGVHLEHSPSYQLVVRGALERFGSKGLLPESELGPLLERMDEATAWMTAPDGTLPTIGDTSAGVEPSRAVQEAAARSSGLRSFPRSGYCMVREGGSYLFVTAGFHSQGHKHSDDLSFCLYEDGRLLVGDAGNPGYDYESAARQFCVSPSAHSGIGLDSYTWIADPRGGGGTGLVAAGSLGDVHAILAQNPRIAPDDRTARRLLVYRPGQALAVIDELWATQAELVERYLQLSPDLSATVLESGAVELGRDGGRVGWLAPFEEEGGAPDSVSALRGRTSPPMGGLYFPHVDHPVACTTVVLSRYGGGTFGYLLSLGPADGEPEPAWVEGQLSGRSAEVVVTGIGDGPLVVQLAGDALDLSRR
ncbi:MAG TPA: heparinase II/III family protein [Solirubrobacterales bacterium]|nr:heparinase II/III family protein [Solirubrobacterales bacterium]